MRIFSHLGESPNAHDEGSLSFLAIVGNSEVRGTNPKFSQDFLLIYFQQSTFNQKHPAALSMRILRRHCLQIQHAVQW
ncbi:MAG: hypothetical protein DMG65_07225 [Candidatus Angelobacter sp. Gp1-AA117]|nr:MAG: hypothetical protein DMG65_07225 [Candidatus Angelobacter sp. Gp1-AA117]